jgi:hypothetical protein
MKMALLSCGPSLALWRDPMLADYGAAVGVNRAVARFACDWWSVGDAEGFAAVRPVGRPHIWTHADTLRRIRKENPARAAEHEAGLYRRDERDRWSIFSATAALMLAPHLGASSVDCYGVDMAGVADWDGTERGNRGEDRWSRERIAWAEAVKLLADAGVSVRRMA